MLSIAALLTAAAAVPQRPVLASPAPSTLARATGQATVRLLESATVRFDDNFPAHRHFREVIIHRADGDYPAKIVEFE